jgi:flagellin
MANTIATNVASINAQRNLFKTGQSLSVSFQRLSSGLRINSAKDDAAGLAISNRLTSQVNGLNVAIRNANDGISLAQTAEGALQESTNILQRIRDLSVQAANGSNDGTDRAALQKEVAQLQQELNRIADTTAFGGRKLLDGTFGSASFQVGAQAFETINVSLSSARATSIGTQRLDAGGTGMGGVVIGVGATAGASTIAGSSTTISGGLGSATITVGSGFSAREIANTVNASSDSTGVKAEARTVGEITASATGSVSFNISSDDSGSPTTAKTVSFNVTNTSDLSGLADAINAVAADTGITAEASGGSVYLFNEAGDDILIENVQGTAINVGSRNFDNTGADVAVAAVAIGSSARIQGQVRLDSTQGFSVTNGDATDFGTTAVTGTLKAVSTIDISSVSGAQSAIGIIDGALGVVDSQRSVLGAVQNRLSSTISNLQSVAENVSAARSRIRDADFAAETAELSKNQILQQAGLSVLAQANASGQSVLTLLQ